jgi:hypothetical protein
MLDDEVWESTLVTSLKQSGFNFILDYKELFFDPKSDLVGGGGYGDVYVGKWLGLRVAIKKFGKRYINKKAVKDFIKEIEVVHGLRHPHIILYMGVSFDTSH